MFVCIHKNPSVSYLTIIFLIITTQPANRTADLDNEQKLEGEINTIIHLSNTLECVYTC